MFDGFRELALLGKLIGQDKVGIEIIGKNSNRALVSGDRFGNSILTRSLDSGFKGGARGLRDILHKGKTGARRPHPTFANQSYLYRPSLTRLLGGSCSDKFYRLACRVVVGRGDYDGVARVRESRESEVAFIVGDCLINQGAIPFQTDRDSANVCAQ
jgi:hypothetical protein